MKKFLLLILLSGAAFFVSCNEGKTKKENADPVDSQIQQLHDKVISIHDEVMPKMSDVMRLKGSLSAKKDSLPATLKDSVDVLIKNLDAADDQMMSWMRQFKPKQTDSTRLKEYYEDQLKRIEEVRTSMDEAIKNSTTFQNSVHQ